jgi:hypothetical protein
MNAHHPDPREDESQLSDWLKQVGLNYVLIPAVLTAILSLIILLGTGSIIKATEVLILYGLMVVAAKISPWT